MYVFASFFQIQPHSVKEKCWFIDRWLSLFHLTYMRAAHPWRNWRSVRVVVSVSTPATCCVKTALFLTLDGKPGTSPLLNVAFSRPELHAFVLREKETWAAGWKPAQRLMKIPHTRLWFEPSTISPSETLWQLAEILSHLPWVLHLRQLDLFLADSSSLIQEASSV